jgi:hypothetical protein
MTLGFTLADRLGARTVPCSVAGCTRTWVQLGGKALALGKGKGDANETGPAASMCEPCKKKLATLTEKQRRCEIHGCHGTFAWSVKDQLEAFATHRPPPKGLCANCESRLTTLEDKEAACVIPGCTRTATISKRAQLVAETEAAAAAEKAANGPAATEAAEHQAVTVEVPAVETVETEAVAADAAPVAEAADAGKSVEAHPHKAKGEKGEKPGRVTFEGPMCGPCGDVARRLTDRPVNCGINGCRRKWTWKADEQIQAFAAGKPNEPPRRMCDGCRASFGKLLDREVRCRTSGCKKTWTWSRFDQLDACVADKPAPKAPSKMCESCFDSFSKLKDVERPCRKSGCKRTWTDKRGAQLARLVRGKSGDPYPQYCEECQKELGDLEGREIKCKTEGCNGTWTWTKEQQLAAGVRPEPKPSAVQAHGETNGETHSDGADAGAHSVEAHDHGAQLHGAQPEAAHTNGALPEGEVGAAGEADTIETATDQSLTTGPTTQAEPATDKGSRTASQRRRDKRRRKQRQIQPPARLCHTCADFLKDKKTLEIPCSQCATPIFWPPESQLQTHLGNWATPSLCGACKRDATEAARKAAKEAIRAHAIETSITHAVGGVPEDVAPPSPSPSPSIPDPASGEGHSG